MAGPSVQSVTLGRENRSAKGAAVRRPDRRVLPTAIGVCIATTLAANMAVLLADQARPHKRTSAAQATSDKLITAAHGSELSKGPVAPYRKHIDPQLMIVSKHG